MFHTHTHTWPKIYSMYMVKASCSLKIKQGDLFLIYLKKLIQICIWEEYGWYKKHPTGFNESICTWNTLIHTTDDPIKN